VGRAVLVARLAGRDLRHRPAQGVLLLLVMMAATTALALGLALRGVTAQPYQNTRAATRGPDVLATAFPLRTGPAADLSARRDVTPLARAPGVVQRSGPFPVAFPVLRAHGQADAVLAQGRTVAPTAVDQPKLTQGSWLRNGGIVVERSFANALGIQAGDRVTLDGRPFRVAGIAVTAALPTSGIGFLEGSTQWPNPGLIWVTEAAARSLATTAHPLGYLLDLRLAHPAAAEAFANRYTAGGNASSNVGNPYLIPWQSISRQDAALVRSEQAILLVGSWLLGLLAIASLVILVGARMADQLPRVGLLKAVGGTPSLVAAVLLAEHLTVALLAAVAGLVAGWLAAPLLTNPGAGLLGTAGSPSLTPATVAVVVAVALAVAIVATFGPAIRAARSSTVDALANAARPPRRRAWLIRGSARLPVPLLLAIRLIARRPRRLLVSLLSITVTVSGLVAVLFAHATLAVSQFGMSAGSANLNLFDVGFASRAQREDQVLLIVTILLGALAAVNAIFITQATVQDTRQPTAVTRALGATPQQVTAGLSGAQILPALAGALLGIPGGYLLFSVASQGGTASQPPAWWLIVAVLDTVLVVAALTTIPAWAGAQRPVAAILGG
jgi:ABC-type antimicrobial peptide transport system permease subunit